MVLVLPYCWYDTLQRAPQNIPANANEEEREEHESEQAQEVARRATPPPLPAPPRLVRTLPVAVVAHEPVRLASVAPPVHPSRLSVRRQQ
ncbi:MAG TPA: hypothetical protein VM734_24960 [Kofleriaceae bacterium]|nr:hypothetical protein [Kofleriaceae bacterium]